MLQKAMPMLKLVLHISECHCGFVSKWFYSRVWLAAKKHLRHQLAHSHAPPHLSTPPSAGVRQQRKFFSLLGCLAVGTLVTSPRTLIQTHRKALLYTAEQAGFIVQPF